MDQRQPYQIIEALVKERESWSDEQVLSELATIQPLPDEFKEGSYQLLENSEWDRDEIWHKGYLYVAHADIAAIRHLDKSIPLLLERACYGDPGEMMRGIFRNSLYWATNRDDRKLADYCIEAFNSPRKGSRLWAVTMLGFLREISGVSEVLDLASKDQDLWIRSAAT